ncbi:hypothetical protein GCM10009102_30760 [Sphingomonas insulae]|uniref:Glycosyltransferase RgtA/B/C/D-like domain-containing protein n=1 Tax=Sphingomonas insulae TaxID=424800 RepID=A0ABN1HZQ9_9SPHN
MAVIARAQTFGNPVVGFDEQFYLLVGDRMLHGAIPYVDIFDRKPIGLFLIFAAARAMGGDGFLQYKLVALVFVVVTALLIHGIARRRAGPFAATLAAIAYILWLNFMEGEGGQSPVFYNLPMVAAAALILGVRGDPTRNGAGAMLLVGIALQIKYSVVAEGLFFGCWLIALAWRAGQRGARLARSIAIWIGLAMLPTLAAFAAYAAIGQASPFVFANVLSALAQGRGGLATQLAGLGAILGILALPSLLVLSGGRSRDGGRTVAGYDRFLLGWLAASAAGVLLYWRFASPHYAMPMLPALMCLLAQAVDAGRAHRIAGLALALVGLVGGQAVLAISALHKGGAREAAAVARAAHVDGGGCIYVYDGYPALYMLTGSCLPTRWPFPGHLATQEESRAAALGVDPAREVARILATHPVAIIDDLPHFDGGNPVTRRILERALASDYVLAARICTGPARMRLVYRRRAEGRPPLPPSAIGARACAS